MQEFGGGSVPAAQVEPVKTEVAKREPSAAPVAPVVKATNLKPIVIPLKGKGVRPITFMPIPAGEGYVGGEKSGVFEYAKISITRPFLMAKLPIDMAQWEGVLGQSFERKKYLEDVLRTQNMRDKAWYDNACAYQAFGGAKAMGVVLQRNPRVEVPAFFDTLNAKFGKYLPKGMVFRPPTLAEYQYVQQGGRSDLWRPDITSIALMDERPAEYAWMDRENLGVAEWLTILRKAGLKIGDGEREKHNWGINFFMRQTLPTGLKPANPYGICDVAYGAFLLDRVGPELAPGKFGEDLKMALLTQGDRSVAGTEDPLFWTESKDYLILFTPTWWHSKLLLILKGDAWSSFMVRVVIGPDLVSEWKARQKK